MPVYEVTIDGTTYEVESQSPLTDVQAYQFAKIQADQNPAPPKKENLNSDPELARHANKAQRFADAGAQPSTYTKRVTESEAATDEFARLEAEYKALEQQMAVSNQLPPEQQMALAQKKRELENKLRVARQTRDQLSGKADVGNVIGGTAGAIAGAFTGPAAPVAVPVLSIAGGALGTWLGGLVDAAAEKMTKDEKVEYLKDKVLTNAMYDAAGNLLFFAGGKVLFMFKKGRPGFAEAERAAGKLVTPANPDTGLNAARRQIRSGDSVFSGTTNDELKDATERGAKILGAPDGSQTVTKGQLTGEPGIIEKSARVKDPGYFQEVGREQNSRLQDAITAVMDRVRGKGAKYAGTDVRTALDDVEQAVKEHLRPVFDDLSKKHEEIVNFAPISREARAELEREFHRRVGILTPTEKAWLRRLAGGGEKLSPSEAQELSSRLSAMARDLESSLEPNSPLRQFIAGKAAQVRKALDDALADEPQYAEARDLYKRMMAAVYNPAFRRARVGGESAAGDKVIRVGEVEGLDALEQLRTLAKEVDTYRGGAKVLEGQTDRAARGALHAFLDDYAGTPEALAKLPRKMGDPQFRRTFEAAIPDPVNRQLLETLSQAAQVVARLRTGVGGAPGVEAAAASGGRAVGAATGSAAIANLASVAARVGSWLAPPTLARALTEPAVRSELPRIARVIQAGKLSMLNSLPEAAKLAMARLDEIAAEEAATEKE